MQITYLNYFLASITAYLGLLLGVILIKLAHEEQKSGREYFVFIKNILFFLIILFLLLFYKLDIILTVILLAFAVILMLNKKIDLEKSGRVYFFLGVIFYLSYFSKIFNLFVIETVLILLFGIPTSSLILKLREKNYYSVFVSNLWFFVPIISLYLIL